MPDLGLSYIVGGRPDQIRVEPDPERLALYGVTLNQLVDKVQQRQQLVAGRRICARKTATSRSSPARRCRAFPISACC